ncbi:isoprenyl transferase [Porphyromonas pogonae]|uniref:isoprenyl transferase n=1 Tax=Porphyromonas pogonae TaxID=867595 RepID=UPI002E769D26|nr:isoprenyl transferase [Porphyromonas pogonae]
MTDNLQNNSPFDENKVPKHVAIIMDGNGRWAKMRGKHRSEGHIAGVDSLRNTIKAASDLGIKYLTIYAFSTENWKRPSDEVIALMDLLAKSVASETPDLIKDGIRLLTIGNIEKLPQDTQLILQESKDATAHNTKLNLVVALSYSSRQEIMDATCRLAAKISKCEISPDALDEDLFSSLLDTAEIPDPDLLIRTGGEVRISNFLLWQAAYAELYFTDTFWPDFGYDELKKAICDYQARERRFGKTSEQIAEECK